MMFTQENPLQINHKKEIEKEKKKVHGQLIALLLGNYASIWTFIIPLQGICKGWEI